VQYRRGDQIAPYDPGSNPTGPCYFGLGAIQTIRMEAMALESHATRHAALPVANVGDRWGTQPTGDSSGGGSREICARPPPRGVDQNSVYEGLHSKEGVSAVVNVQEDRSSRETPGRHFQSRVVVNAMLSPMQERNLSAALGGREVCSDWGE